MTPWLGMVSLIQCLDRSGDIKAHGVGVPGIGASCAQAVIRLLPRNPGKEPSGGRDQRAGWKVKVGQGI